MYLNDRIEKKRNKRNMKLGGLKFAARLPWKQISQMMKLLQCTCARIMVPLQVYLVVVNPLCPGIVIFIALSMCSSGFIMIIMQV